MNIRQISQNWAEQMGYYRFLDNEQVSVSELVRCLTHRCETQVGERHVLAISDTSEINLPAHVGRLKGRGLGVVGNDHDCGLFSHPTLDGRTQKQQNSYPQFTLPWEIWGIARLGGDGTRQSKATWHQDTMPRPKNV